MDWKTLTRASICGASLLALAMPLQAAQIRAFGGVILSSITVSDFDVEPEVPDEPFARSKVSVAQRSGFQLRGVF